MRDGDIVAVGAVDGLGEGDGVVNEVAVGPAGGDALRHPVSSVAAIKTIVGFAAFTSAAVVITSRLRSDTFSPPCLPRNVRVTGARPRYGN
jgi:hypothetical protein